MSTHVVACKSNSTPDFGVLARIVGFFFAFRLFLVLIAVHVFGQEARFGVETGLAFNYLLLSASVFAVLGNNSRSLISIAHIPCMRWVAIFLGFSGISLLWSVTASLPAAVAFWCAMTSDTAIVLLLLRTGEAEMGAQSLMKGFVYGATLIGVIAWMMPLQSDLRLGDEELLGPNQIGYLCALALFFIQYLGRRKDGDWRFFGWVLALTLLRSLSKTTIAAFLVSQIWILMRDRSIGRRSKWLMVMSCVIVLVGFSSLIANYYEVYIHAGSQSETLTGRIGIWTYFLSEALQCPWLGHGFHSVWKVAPPFGPELFEARHAHNEMLQQFYVYGAVGVVIWIGVYSSFYRRLRRFHDGSLRVVLTGMLLFAVVRGLADTEPFDLSLPVWAITMFVCVID